MPALPGATNVAIQLDAMQLTISVDLAVTSGASKSGKTTTVASTSGSKPIGATGAVLSLSVNAKAEKVQLPNDPKQFQAPVDMKNLRVELEGSLLKMIVDMTKDCGPSSTGNTTIIASSAGMKTLGGTNVLLNLNLFCKGKPKLTAEAVEAAAAAPGAKGGFQNVKIASSGTVCTFTVDLSTPIGDSKSGKAVILGTSNGFAEIPDSEASCNFIVCKSAKAREETVPEALEADLEGAQNIKCGVTATMLTVKFDLAHTGGKSSTGKSTVIATTSGMKTIPNTPLSLNCSVFKASGAKKRGAPTGEPTAKRLKAAEGDEPKEEEEAGSAD